MNEELPSKPTFLPQEEPEDFKAAYDKLVQIDKIIDFEKLNKNSAVVIKLGGDESHRMRMHQAFVKFLASKHTLFKNKKLTVLFLNEGDSLDTLTEEEMNQGGWYRKEKNLIINPFG